MAKLKFPVLAVILLIFALAWGANEMGYFKLDIPWFPVIIAIAAIGMIFNRFNN